MKRGKPLNYRKKTREMIWPSMGWRRTFHYYRHRTFRTGDSTYKITAGLAAGAAVCFTPFLGTHILQAMFFSWLIGGSVVAGIVGTAVGTPWTYPFMFLMSYKTGLWFCTIFGLGGFESDPNSIIIANADHEPWGFFSYMLAHPWQIFFPFTVGGYVCALLSWPLSYAALYYPVRAARKAYTAKHRRKRGGKT